MKEICQSAFITLVGTHVSALPEETLNIDRRIDAIVRYEYDYTLLDLAKTLSTKGDLRNVLGLSFREGDSITHNPARPYIETLDELPFVSKVYNNFSGRIENLVAKMEIYQKKLSAGKGHIL